MAIYILALSMMMTKNLDEAKSFIQLAEQLSCPNIQVVPQRFSKGPGKK